MKFKKRNYILIFSSFTLSMLPVSFALEQKADDKVSSYSKNILSTRSIPQTIEEQKNLTLTDIKNMTLDERTSLKVFNGITLGDTTPIKLQQKGLCWAYSMGVCAENNMLYQPELFTPDSSDFPYNKDTLYVSPFNIDYTNMRRNGKQAVH